MFDTIVPVASSSQSELPKDPPGSIGTFLEQLEKKMNKIFYKPFTKGLTRLRKSLKRLRTISRRLISDRI
ncbi:hypothetical protein SESBI_36351 [Sesbania bispinosa]|nr:hypothetical protein SESBI_36351 [Sesbania bispinosa]